MIKTTSFTPRRGMFHLEHPSHPCLILRTKAGKTNFFPSQVVHPKKFYFYFYFWYIYQVYIHKYIPQLFYNKYIKIQYACHSNALTLLYFLLLKNCYKMHKKRDPHLTCPFYFLSLALPRLPYEEVTKCNPCGGQNCTDVTELMRLILGLLQFTPHHFTLPAFSILPKRFAALPVIISGL